MCFWCTAGEDVLNCAVTGLSSGQSSESVRVQLLPRGGLAPSCCFVETDTARGKTVQRSSMTTFCSLPPFIIFFPPGDSMEQMLFGVRNVPCRSSCDFSPIYLSCCWIRSEVVANRAPVTQCKMSLIWTLCNFSRPAVRTD